MKTRRIAVTVSVMIMLTIFTGCEVSNNMQTSKAPAATAVATVPADAQLPFSDMLDGAGNFKSETAKQQLSAKYDTYIQSYLSEIGEGVHDDMKELAEEIGELQDAEDVREWCEDYREFYEDLKHWEREINIAEMIVPEPKAELHKNLAYAMYTLSKVCAYVETSVSDAEKGNVQPLKENANTFREGYEAALTLYDHAAADLGNAAVK